MATILFDLDGTLVDSVADLAAAANVVRGEFGLDTLDEQVVASHVGDGARKLVERAFADLDDLDVMAVLKRFRAIYLEHCTERTTVYPGVLETLARLAPRPMAIVSNKPQTMCEKIAEYYGLDRYLSAVVGQRPKVPVKPAPDLLRIALEDLGSPDGPVWMVGDSHNDVLSGRAIGAGTVGVTWGIGDLERLRAARPDHVVDSAGELVRIVGA